MCIGDDYSTKCKVANILSEGPNLSETNIK